MSPRPILFLLLTAAFHTQTAALHRPKIQQGIGFFPQRRAERKDATKHCTSITSTRSYVDTIDNRFPDETSDSFHNSRISDSSRGSTNDHLYSHTAHLVNHSRPRKPTFTHLLKECIKGCYVSCPGQAYSDALSPPSHSSNVFDGKTILVSTSNQSLLRRAPSQLFKKYVKKSPREAPKKPIASDSAEISSSELEAEPSPTTLAGITKALIPQTVWESLTGKEFYFPSVISNLVRTSLNLAMDQCDAVEWKPADSTTKQLLEGTRDVTEALVNEGQVMVWLGKFTKTGYGSHLPLVKTTSVLPLSPKDMACLLMDSNRVQSYNKMSLGRSDMVVFQNGVDTTAQEGGFALDGEAKIVRNVTKPPLTKKLMDFVTFMYARQLTGTDCVSAGMLGGQGGPSTTTAPQWEEEDQHDYIVVSRAISGGKWGGQNNPVGKTRGGGSSSTAKEGQDEMIRSEILLGVNLLRCVPGKPDMTEVTAITHVNSPSVPTMLAGKVGVKGAIDFVRDIRSLYQ